MRLTGGRGRVCAAGYYTRLGQGMFAGCFSSMLFVNDFIFWSSGPVEFAGEGVPLGSEWVINDEEWAGMSLDDDSIGGGEGA